MSDTTRSAPADITVTVDGKTVTAKAGELLIEVAERAGVYIPRFCYHPRMEPVGMCRMCLVEVSGPRGFSLQPACYQHAADGQEIRTDTDKARKAQEGVLEFLLVNHPLDCPVCDKGGECPLQDQALSHGPGESRFVEEKRHFEKPITIGPLVQLDRERCIQCARCTRFAAEVAGEALIDFAFRGDGIEVSTFPTRPFSSYFSGNTVQICPVGALTAVPYRFKSRPWDLEQAETTCTLCAVGCRVVAQSSAGRLVRYLGIDADPVNQSWLCDKGRFSFEATDAPSRLVRPEIQKDGTRVAARWGEALAEVARAIHAANLRFGPSGVAMLGGARLTNEDAYAWAKLMKGVLKSDNVDAQLGDGLPADLVLGLPRATIDEAASARAVVVLSGDLREELPVLHLRLRTAALSGVPLVDISPVPGALGEVARATCAHRPGDTARLVAALVASGADPGAAAAVGAAPDALAAVRSVLAAASDAAGDAEARGTGVVVVLGRPSLADDGRDVVEAAALLHRALPGARFLPALRRANVHGALDMGLAPGLLPGRVGLDAGRALFEESWGAVPADRGQDATGILEAAAAGEIGVLLLVGADPLSDFPDRALARAALETAGVVVACATHEDPTTRLAHIVLPLAGNDERSGTTTNLEGRVTRLAQKVVPPGVAWPAWAVAAEVARVLDNDLGLESVEAASREIARLAPAHRGVDLDLLGRPERRDGVVVPLAETPVALGARRAPRPIDPIATPGILSVEEQGAPLFAGAAEPPGGFDDESVDAAPEDAAPPSRPGVLRLSGLEDFSAPRVPAPVGGAFRLVVRRSLYDRGTLVQAAPALGPLAPDALLAVAPDALQRLGVEPGGRARLRGAGRDGSPEVVVEVVAEPGLPLDVVALGANLLPELPAGLVAARQAVTDVVLEPLS